MPEQTHGYDKRHASVCGLFCPACPIFMAHKRSPELKPMLAEMLGIPPEALKCEGCRTTNRFATCEQCTFDKCANERGIDFCGQCDEFPCAEYKEFQLEKPHRIELYEDQQRLREVDVEVWLKEKAEHFICPECGNLNSFYMLQCPKCGNTPGCAFVQRHMDKIKMHLSKGK
jgi:predicted RNA-binding Zn-ribbon protein involved in translation (DUF1610 family)